MLVGVASLIPALPNIGILQQKQAKLRKHLQHSVVIECPLIRMQGFQEIQIFFPSHTFYFRSYQIKKNPGFTRIAGGISGFPLLLNNGFIENFTLCRSGSLRRQWRAKVDKGHGEQRRIFYIAKPNLWKVPDCCKPDQYNDFRYILTFKPFISAQ